jgi:hypothetical protein
MNRSLPIVQFKTTRRAVLAGTAAAIPAAAFASVPAFAAADPSDRVEALWRERAALTAQLDVNNDALASAPIVPGPRHHLLDSPAGHDEQPFRLARRTTALERTYFARHPCCAGARAAQSSSLLLIKIREHQVDKLPLMTVTFCLIEVSC